MTHIHTLIPMFGCAAKHIFLFHVYRSVSLSRMRRYTQLAYLFHQCATSLLITDCTVRHPGVERPFSSILSCRRLPSHVERLVSDYRMIMLMMLNIRVELTGSLSIQSHGKRSSSGGNSSSEWQEMLTSALHELAELLTGPNNTVSAYELQSSRIIPALLMLLAPQQQVRIIV